MTKEFIPYEQALALQELGFDEPCLKGYTEEYKRLLNFSSNHTNTSVKNMLPTKPLTAPLFQQAFRWFREKYNLHHIVLFNNIENNYDFIYGERIGGSMLGTSQTYEEAELECLKKLIQLIEKKVAS